MGVFESGDYAGQVLGPPLAKVQTERCKPDYEAIIARTKIALGATSDLFNAMIEYGKIYRPGITKWGDQNSFAGLVGALYLEKTELENTLTKVMAEYEANG